MSGTMICACVTAIPPGLRAAISLFTVQLTRSDGSSAAMLPLLPVSTDAVMRRLDSLERAADLQRPRQHVASRQFDLRLVGEECRTATGRSSSWFGSRLRVGDRASRADATEGSAAEACVEPDVSPADAGVLRRVLIDQIGTTPSFAGPGSGDRDRRAVERAGQ